MDNGWCYLEPHNGFYSKNATASPIHDITRIDDHKWVEFRVNGEAQSVDDHYSSRHLITTNTYYEWCNNGYLHRDNGNPACITRDPSGDIITYSFHLNGLELTMEDYVKQIDPKYREKCLLKWG